MIRRTRTIWFGLILGGFVAHAAFLAVVAEDAYITFRYARHVAMGEGFVWNVGDAPVEGYTNFLWLLICAGLFALGVDVPTAAQILGVAASLGTLFYVYRYARGMGLSAAHALMPCGLLAASGPFATWAASGMETALFGLLVVATAYHFTRWLRGGVRRHLLVSLAAVLLATLTRPEGVIVFAVLTATLVLSHRRSLRWREYAWAIPVYVVPVGAYFVWRHEYFGYWLPNTFYAKTGGTTLQYVRGVKYAVLFALHFAVPLLPVAAAWIWEHPNGHRRWRSTPGSMSLLQQFRSSASLLVGASLIATYTMYIVYVGGDYMAMYRFFVPVMPLFYLATAAMASALLIQVAGSPHKQRLAVVLVAGVAGLTAIQSTPIEQRIFRQPETMHGTWRGVQTERRMVARFKVVADFFKAYSGPSDTLALEPIGVIPFFTGMRVHSVHALVDTHIAHHSTADEALGLGLPGHEKRDFPYVLNKRPTYIMFSNHLTPEPQVRPSESAAVDAVLARDYEARSVWLTDADNDESGYFSFLALKGTPDRAIAGRRLVRRLPASVSGDGSGSLVDQR